MTSGSMTLPYFIARFYCQFRWKPNRCNIYWA